MLTGKCHSAHRAANPSSGCNRETRRPVSRRCSHRPLRVMSIGEEIRGNEGMHIRFQAIICFAPAIQAVCPPQYTGALAGATVLVEVEPVTRHLKFCMYMFGSPP